MLTPRRIGMPIPNRNRGSTAPRSRVACPSNVGDTCATCAPIGTRSESLVKPASPTAQETTNHSRASAAQGAALRTCDLVTNRRSTASNLWPASKPRGIRRGDSTRSTRAARRPDESPDGFPQPPRGTARRSDDQGPGGRGDGRGQGGGAGQEGIHPGGAGPALGDGPDDQRLATAGVATHEDAFLA